MSTVILDNVKVELTAEQILAAYRQLPPEEQARVYKDLEDADWQRRFDELMAKIRACLREAPISEERIDEEVRIVREARRARRAA